MSVGLGEGAPNAAGRTGCGLTPASLPLDTRKNREFVADELVPALTWVPDHLPKKKGKKVHRSSVSRWLTKGCDGVRLRGWKAGRTWMTTPAAVRAFTAELAAKAARDAPRVGVSVAKPPRLGAETAAAAAELDAAGL